MHDALQFVRKFAHGILSIISVLMIAFWVLAFLDVLQSTTPLSHAFTGAFPELLTGAILGAAYLYASGVTD